MNSEQDQQKNLIDTTDCLEAIDVFRGWKNFLFVVLILCLLLSQASFWLVNTGCITAEQAGGDKTYVAAAGDSEQVAETAKAKKEDIKKAAEQIVASDKPAEAEPHQPQRKFAYLHLKVEFKHLAWIISLVNFVLVFAAILYCLTILFSLKVSLVGRLGGINHICRAFFLSLVVLILLVPWQLAFGFGTAIVGVAYTSDELLKWYTVEVKDGSILEVTLYYLRFCGYWLLAVLLLILSQVRSARWSKTVLRRLEVI